MNGASTWSVWLSCIVVMGLLSGGCGSRPPSAGQPAAPARAPEDQAARGKESTIKPQHPALDKKTASPAGPFRFADILPGSGVDFIHVSGMTEVKQFPTANGSGLAIFDFDNDGKMDLCFATGNLLPIDPARAVANRLYRNTGGGRFEDVTERSGLGFRGYCHGVITGDIDNDGDQDVFLCNYGGDALFLNNGNGTFSDISQSSGVRASSETWSSSAAFLDFDNDGDLDLYVTRYGDWQWPRDDKFCGDSKRKIRRYCSPKELRPVRHVLFRNNGDHTYSDVTRVAGIDRADGHGFGAVAADLDGDNRVDLYVANDQDPNFLFLNRGDGTFRDATDESGAGLNIEGHTSAGMGVDAEDLDGDGRPELFVTNFQEEYNTLFKNLRPGTFLDVTAVFGLAVDSLPWIGWGCSLADFDGDGWPDIVVANGHIDDNAQLPGQPSGYAQPPLVASKLRRKAVPACHGRCGPLLRDQPRCPWTGHRRSGRRRRPGHRRQPQRRSTRDSSQRHAATRKLDPAQARRHSLEPRRDRRDGDRGSRRPHHPPSAEGGSSLMSSHDPRMLIGLGGAADFARVTVKWPSGAVSLLEKVATSKSHEIREPKE